MRRFVATLLAGLCVQTACAQDMMWLRMTGMADRPPVRAAAIAAYDRDRDAIVVHGGVNKAGFSIDETWEFDGLAWRQMQVPGIGKMGEHGMVYDESRKRCVMVTTYSTYARRTVLWDGLAWAHEPIPLLPPRYGFAMAYDSSRSLIFYHGGIGSLDSSDPLSDFWQKSGPDPWVRLADQTMPNRSHHAMAYDRARDRIVLYGGGNRSRTFADTWEWDGGSWKLMQEWGAPGPRAGMRMAYHEGLERVIFMFGGDRGLGPGTWAWDGQTWTDIAPIPALQTGAAMAYDSRRDRLVLLAGALGSSVDDTWVLVPACRANCNADAHADGRHKLDIQDFTCFQNAFALGDKAKADCNKDDVLEIRDFTCFQNLFALGCP